MNLGFTGRIARNAATRPWVTIGAWAVGLALAIVAAGSLGDVLTQDDHNLVTTESDRAADLDTELRAADTAGEMPTELVIIGSSTAEYGEPAFTAVVDDTVAALLAVDGVVAVDASDPGAQLPISASRQHAILTATLSLDHPEDVGLAINEAMHGVDHAGFSVSPYGAQSSEAAFDALAEETLVTGEMIGIAVALVILLIVFGALVAAGIPLMVAIVSIVAAVGATAVVGRAFELSFFIVNMITMMGLALGIDYTLVMVQRFREELAHGRTVIDSVAIAGNTANRAVFFSGLTVVVSLLGLLLVPSTIMVSLGLGAIIVAVMSVIAALTLLPAVLKLLGHRVNKGRLPWAHPGATPRRWEAIARGVTRRPAIAAVVGLALLATLAVPMFSMRLTFPGTDSLPADNDFRVASDTLVNEFGYGQSATTVVVEDADDARTEVQALADAIESSPAFAETGVSWEGDTAFIDTKDVFDSADARAEDAIHTLRTDTIPAVLEGTGAVASVGGDQAGSIDFTALIASSAPWVLLVVLGVSLLLLLVTFRSIVVAATAIGLNLLSAAAAFGMLVAVFQYGWGASVFGFAQVDGIAPWIPLFLFAVLFGLSMDYHVFLISRIKERYLATGDTRDAVVFGLSRTGSLITGAALIMVAVFAGFALGDLAEFQQMGFGLAAAIIIDATVVRTFLVPAIMTLLGERNWYLPRWLGWLPQVHIEAPATQYIEANDADDVRERALV